MIGALLAIAGATRVEVSRQPVHGFVVLGTLLAYALSPSIAMFSFGEDLSLLKDFGASTLFLSGTILVAAGASSAVGRELEARTAQALLTKPVARSVLLSGKLLGILAAALWAAYIYTIALCLAARIRPPAHAAEAIDGPAVTAAFGSVGAAVLVGFIRSLKSPEELGRAALKAAGVSFTAGLLLPVCFTPDWRFEPSLAWIDPLVLKACALGFLGLGVLASVAVLLSVVLWRSGVAGTLVVFVLGLALGRDSALGLVLPDLQLFWVGEAFYRSGGELPAGYLLEALAYSLAYSAASLAAASWILERSEV